MIVYDRPGRQDRQEEAGERGVSEARFTIMQPSPHEPKFRDLLKRLNSAGIMGVTTSVPWQMILPHEKQALLNHYQTLRRLHERGGLSPGEAVAVLEDR